MYDGIIEFGITASRWLQITYPQLQAAMAFISDLGQLPVYLAIITLLYWCISKQFGGQLAYMLVFSAFLNTAGKQLLRQPRPYWFDSTLNESGSSGYGFPSGHVQSATVLAFFFAGWFRETWLWVLATIFTFTMALSRVYLGVHFVHDVVAGFLLGCLLLVTFALGQPYLTRYFRPRLFGQRLLVMALLPFVLLVVWSLAIAWIGEPDVRASWVELANSAENALSVGVLQSLGMLFGLGVGLSFERSRVRFQTDGPLWKRLLRFVVGSAGTFGLLYGLGALNEIIIPADPVWVGLPIWFVEFALLGAWITYYAPKLFVAIKLADFSAEAELPYELRGISLPSNRD